MFEKVNRFAFAATAALITAPALAHPGQGRDGGSHELTHYFTEPEHLAPIGLAALAGVAGAAFVVWYRRKA